MYLFDFLNEIDKLNNKNNFDKHLHAVADEDKYSIFSEVPGATKENIDINYNDEGYLTIGVNYKYEKGTYQISKKFSEKVFVPDADVRGATATIENGILEIVIPKKKKVSHKITIK